MGSRRVLTKDWATRGTPGKVFDTRTVFRVYTLTGASVGIRPATVAGRQTGSWRTPRGDTRERVRTSHYDGEPGSISLVVDEPKERREKRPKRVVGKNSGRGNSCRQWREGGDDNAKSCGNYWVYDIEVYDSNFPSSPSAKYFTKFMIRSLSYQNLPPPLFF